MYTTIQEVILATIAKYEGVTELSKESGCTCLYSHELNGVGCAIGCHLTAEIAEHMDNCAVGVDISSLYSVPSYKKELQKVFSPEIDLSDLVEVQAAHDVSDTVFEFVGKLETLLTTSQLTEAEMADSPPQ